MVGWGAVGVRVGLLGALGSWELWVAGKVVFCFVCSGAGGGGGEWLVFCLVWLLAGGRGKSLVCECHDGLDILVAGGGGTGQALL